MTRFKLTDRDQHIEQKARFFAMAFAFIGEIIKNSIDPHPALRRIGSRLIRQVFVFFIEGRHCTLQGGQRQFAQILNVLS